MVPVEARKDGWVVQTWSQQGQRWAGCLISPHSQPVKKTEQYSCIIWCVVTGVRAPGVLTLLLVHSQAHGIPIPTGAESHPSNTAHNVQWQ